MINPRPSGQSPRRSFVLITLIGAILIRLPLLPTPLTYANDIWRQADTASIAYHFSINGFKLLYPQIFWGGNGPGYVEAEFQLYPFIVALFYRVLGEQLWLGRLVSLLFTIPAFVLFYLLARRVLEPRPAVWALAFFGISPLYIRYSIAFMPEATVMCFYVAALYFFYRWLDEQCLTTLLLAAICTSLAILVKPTSIHIGLIFALLALERYGWSVLKRWDLWLAATVCLLPGMLWYVHAHDLYLQYGNTFGILSGGDSKFGSLRYWIAGHFYLSVLKLETTWVLAGGGLALFLPGLALALRKRQNLLIVYGMIVIFIYYLIVARYAQEEWGIQYHVYAVPFAALGIGIGFDWLLTRTRKTIGVGIALASVLAILVWTAYPYRDMLATQPNRLVKCATTVEKVVPKEARMIVSTTSFAQDNGVPNNYQEPTIFFYSHRYGWSLPGDRHEPETVEELRRAGAGYFVIYSQELYRASPDLVAYLNANAEQIGDGIEAGCGIYRFRQ